MAWTERTQPTTTWTERSDYLIADGSPIGLLLCITMTNIAMSWIDRTESTTTWTTR